MNQQLIERLFGLIFTCLCLGGCTTKPNFEALYALEAQQSVAEKRGHVQAPVILVPGIVSSLLADDQGKEVWFGGIAKLLWGDYSQIALDIDSTTLMPLPSTLVATEMPHSVMGFDFYGSLFDVLEKYGHYRRAYPGEAYIRHERRYYQFPYDWRYGAVETVKKLDALIEQIRKDYRDPNLKVDLVGHSMGGLVLRYYLRYGTADILDDNDFPVTQAGAKKVRRVIQLGAPNLGSVSSLHQLMDGYTTLVSKVEVEDLVTLPSVYELLPHPLNDWLVTNEGKVLDRDLFDAEIWKRFEWGIYSADVETRVVERFDDLEEGKARLALLQRYFERHLERARRFVWSLTVPVPDIEYGVIAFGGNCVPTPARLLVEEVDGESVIRLSPDDVKNRVKGVDYERLMLEPGDGRVTKPSLLARNLLDPTRPRHPYSFFPLDYAFFLCHEHGQLTGNVSFQDNLLNVLLEAE